MTFGVKQASVNWGNDWTIVDEVSITRSSLKLSPGGVIKLESSNSGSRRGTSQVPSHVSSILTHIRVISRFVTNDFPCVLIRVIVNSASYLRIMIVT